MADWTITDQESITLTANPVNADGSAYDGPNTVSWSIDNTTAATLHLYMSGDGTVMSADIVPTNITAGTDVPVTVTAVDQFGLTTTCTIMIRGTTPPAPPPPTRLTINASAPRPKPRQHRGGA